jgi:hypothetical protein
LKMIRRRGSPWFMVILLVALLALSGCQGGQVGTPTPSANSWAFVIFGDTRGDFDPAKTPPYDLSTATGVSPVLPQIATKIASMNPEFVLHVGDLTCGDLYRVMAKTYPGLRDIPYAEQFQAFEDAVQPITAAHIPLYTVRGNHEVSCGDGVDGKPDPTLAAAYYQAFGRYMPQNDPSQKGLTYSFSHKQVTVVAVDQYSNYVKPDPPYDPDPKNVTWGKNFWGYHTIDQAWVIDQLYRATTPFKIVMAHEPIFIASGVAYDENGPRYHWSTELYFGPPRFNGDTSRQQFVDMMGTAGSSSMRWDMCTI